MHKKTALYFVHYEESEKIEKSFAFNVDIFKLKICVYFLLTTAKPDENRVQETEKSDLYPILAQSKTKTGYRKRKSAICTRF